MSAKQIWIIAGPNGSGKTTLTERYMEGKLPVINPDTIARNLNPQNPNDPKITVQAGRLALKQQRDMLTQGNSFALETTFSGNREIKLMKDAKAAGYKINLVYVSLDHPRANRVRVAERVAKGGHHVSAKDIVRRYERSMENVKDALKHADRAYVLDNSGKRTRMVVKLEKQQVKSVAINVPAWVKQLNLPLRQREIER